MLFFYFLFFIFLDSFSTISVINLTGNTSNFFREFFFCLDSFSTTAIIVYLIVYFVFNNWLIFNILNIKLKSTTFFYLKLRFLIILIKNLSLAIVIITSKNIKRGVFNQIHFLKKIFIFLKKTSLNKVLLWRPLFKRWSYFGIWAKTNNKK